MLLPCDLTSSEVQKRQKVSFDNIICREEDSGLDGCGVRIVNDKNIARFLGSSVLYSLEMFPLSCGFHKIRMVTLGPLNWI